MTGVHMLTSIDHNSCNCIRQRLFDHAQVDAKVPEVLYQSWEADHDGLILVLEDLSCQANAVQDLAEITRLTHQALGLNFAQVRAG